MKVIPETCVLHTIYRHFYYTHKYILDKYYVRIHFWAQINQHEHAMYVIIRINCFMIIHFNIHVYCYTALCELHLSQKIGKPKSFKSHWKQAKQWYYAVHVIAILIKDFKLKLFTKCSLSRNNSSWNIASWSVFINK
jgi:hypothetical protein